MELLWALLFAVSLFALIKFGGFPKSKTVSAESKNETTEIKVVMNVIVVEHFQKYESIFADTTFVLIVN